MTTKYTFLLPAFKGRYLDESKEIMMNPKVSVIIPNYNHAKYLEQRIESVLNQTYQDFEVIILDDCSPDNGASRAVIERYRSNPHVSHIVYNEQNSGSTFIQWQKGFSLAKGEIIWIAESDDWCELNFLETLMPLWEKYPDCSVIQSGVHCFHDDGTDAWKNEHTGKITYSNGTDFIKYNMVCSGTAIPNASAVTFRKDVAMSLPQDYMEYKSAGDRLFWIYMLERGNYCKIDLPLNHFRIHQNKVSFGKEIDGTQSRERYRINKYLHTKGYYDKLMWAEEQICNWDYLVKYPLFSDETRTSLLNLWFPCWWQGKVYISALRKYKSLYLWMYKRLKV